MVVMLWGYSISSSEGPGGLSSQHLVRRFNVLHSVAQQELE